MELFSNNSIILIIISKLSTTKTESPELESDWKELMAETNFHFSLEPGHTISTRLWNNYSAMINE